MEGEVKISTAEYNALRDFKRDLESKSIKFWSVSSYFEQSFVVNALSDADGVKEFQMKIKSQQDEIDRLLKMVASRTQPVKVVEKKKKFSFKNLFNFQEF